VGVNVAAVCRKVGITRQNYYARRKQRQRRAVDGELVAQWVKEERQLQPRLGARKLHVMFKQRLAEAGVKLGRDRLFEVLREREMLLERRPAQNPRTTNSYHCLPVFRNQIKDLAVSGPNQVWVGDLTYLRTEAGFLYLALLTDKSSRKIVGYHCGDTLEAMGCIRALEMALADLPKGVQPIHHSDRTIRRAGELCRRGGFTVVKVATPNPNPAVPGGSIHYAITVTNNGAAAGSTPVTDT